MSIATLAVVISITANIALSISNEKQYVQEEVALISELLASGTAAAIAFDDPQDANSSLSVLNNNPLIANVHIYAKQTFTDELSFFASYNREGIPAIPTKLDQIDELMTPRVGDSYLELVREINRDSESIGYIYVRASLEQLNDFIFRSVVFQVIVGSLILLLALFVILRVQRHISEPIQQLVDVFKKVAREKDYSQKASSFNLDELNQLSNSFNTMIDRISQHMGKQQKAEKEITVLNQSLEEKVSQRTDALKEANQELLQTLEKLHQYQNKIVETEKMASLGDMVAGVAHEVNTPIGLGVTASTLMMDRMAVIKEAFENKNLKASQLERFMDESNENLGIIFRNLNRAADLISSFKQVAVDQSSESNRVFTFHQLMHEVLISLRPKLKKTQHEVNLNCDESLTIESKPGPINQILINLIMNSIIHGFEDIEQGEVKIDVGVHGGHLTITYSDNGKGISEHLRKRIFDPFVTTKRGEGGSGLGMHLVYNLVTQALNGTISVDSVVGQGVVFDISFPVKVMPSMPSAGSSDAG